MENCPLIIIKYPPFLTTVPLAVTVYSHKMHVLRTSFMVKISEVRSVSVGKLKEGHTRYAV